MSANNDLDSNSNAKRQSESLQDNKGSAKKRKTSNAFLSEEEKKARHIASEKKRRETIRQAFDRIVDLVPNLTPAESRTEVAVLTKSANFIDQLRYENEKLIEVLQSQNIEIPQEVLSAFAKTNGSNTGQSQKN